MKVLLVDDHTLVRNGIASLLMANNMEVVGEAGDGLEAIEQARALQPDIILMDIQMPRCNGLEATRLIKAEMPQVKVIMLTISDDEEDLFEAIKSGASGYLLKNLKAEVFFELIAGVVRGEAPIAPRMAAKMLQEFTRQAEAPKTEETGYQSLTAREAEVLGLVADGKGNKEIASGLYISESTVKYHLRHILEKLHMENRSQVIAYAARRGLGSKEGAG